MLRLEQHCGWLVTCVSGAHEYACSPNKRANVALGTCCSLRRLQVLPFLLVCIIPHADAVCMLTCLRASSQWIFVVLSTMVHCCCAVFSGWCEWKSGFKCAATAVAAAEMQPGNACVTAHCMMLRLHTVLHLHTTYASPTQSQETWPGHTLSMVPCWCTEGINC
jgi:hypothetical protein